MLRQGGNAFPLAPMDELTTRSNATQPVAQASHKWSISLLTEKDRKRAVKPPGGAYGTSQTQIKVPMNYNPEPISDAPVPDDETPELHHGDLRKGAYLRRRAAYQLQANAPSTAQAGTLPAGSDATRPGRETE
jgi:hypothetical protein